MNSLRMTWSASVALVAFSLVNFWLVPWPANDPCLRAVAQRARPDYVFLWIGWNVILFVVPYLSAWTLVGIAARFGKDGELMALVDLPNYVPPAEREELYVTLGEVHEEREEGPSQTPKWQNLPGTAHRPGLEGAVMGVGAIGSGKTASGMLPYCEQVLRWKWSDPDRKIAAVILDIKGNLEPRLREILKGKYRSEVVTRTVDRLQDLKVVGFGQDSLAYNPLECGLRPLELSYFIGLLVENVYGKAKEPFWRMAYTNMMTFVIMLHKILYGYVTFADIYRTMTDEDVFQKMVVDADVQVFGKRSILIKKALWATQKNRWKTLRKHGFKLDPALGMYVADLTPKLDDYLTYTAEIRKEVQEQSTGSGTLAEKHELVEIKRYCEKRLAEISDELKTGIKESIANFLSVFAVDLEVERIFCPPASAYAAGSNYGVFHGFEQAIKQGWVVMLNCPLAKNANLAKIIGVMFKLDAQRNILERSQEMADFPEKIYRHVALFIDEYQFFATVGESDPIGDDKFFSLCREPLCIPFVFFQSFSSLKSALPGESWRTVAMLFRTKILGAQTDTVSAQECANLCGYDYQYMPSWGVTQTDQNADLSPVDNWAEGKTASLGVQKNYSPHRLHIFDTRVFSEMPNHQAICLMFDGHRQQPPTRLYLKPYFRDVNKSYFHQLAAGEI